MGTITPNRRNSVEKIHISAWQFVFPTGATLALAGSRYPGYSFDASADEVVRGHFTIPKHWERVRVELLWANMAESSGGVRWTVNFAIGLVGASLNSDFGGALDMTAVAGAQHVLTRTVMSVGTPIAPAEVVHIRVTRRGTHVADTLNNDACLIGVNLIRV